MGCKTLTAFAVLSAAALAFAAPTKYEAEDQAGIPTTDVSTDDEGAKYVKPADAAGMTFTVKAEETAVYDITARVRIKIYAWITSKIVVNGVEAGSMLTTPRNCDSSYVISASAKMKVG